MFYLLFGEYRQARSLLDDLTGVISLTDVTNALQPIIAETHYNAPINKTPNTPPKHKLNKPDNLNPNQPTEKHDIQLRTILQNRPHLQH